MHKTAINPLAKHFRQPAIYLRLPSGGAYWPEDTIEMPATSELPVYPMTTRDEITLRTPDALLNGQGIVDVIESCCPSIKDAWQVPSCDVDAILVSIRIASYGNEMEVNSDCPHCEASSRHSIDLNSVMDRVRMPNYSSIVNVDNLKVRLKPQPYSSTNRSSQILFEETRLLQAINEELPEEQRTEQFNQHMDRLLELNMEGLVASTEYIETEDGQRVEDNDFLLEFYSNAPATTIKTVRNRIEEIAKEGALPKVGVVCEACEKTYEVNIEFNYTSFFDLGS